MSIDYDPPIIDLPIEPSEGGVPAGGTTGQVLAKNSGADYDTEWVDQSGGGVSPIASLIGEYKADAVNVGGQPASGKIRYNNATQISATNVTVNHITDSNVDIDLFLSELVTGQKFIIQDKNQSDNIQIFSISSAPVHSGANYWTIPVTLDSSSGTGTTGFANNHTVFIAVFGGSGGSSSSSLDLVSYTYFGGL